MFYPDFQTFRNQTFLKDIAKKEKWTISTSEKMPIDMRFVDEYEPGFIESPIRGAEYTDERCLVTLDELHNITTKYQLGEPSNYAFYLNAQTDHIVILDIEPICPENIKNYLLNANAIYREKSMSGKGVHMVFPFDESWFKKYPALKDKTNIKQKNKYYEILIQHYVTFTGNILPEPDKTDDTIFNELMTDLASSQVIITNREVINHKLIEPQTKAKTEILENLYEYSVNNFKSDDDDDSHREFTYMTFLLRRLKNLLQTATVLKEGHIYSIEEQLWFIYQTAVAFLPERPKHKQVRRMGSDSLPWLHYLTYAAYCKTTI